MDHHNIITNDLSIKLKIIDPRIGSIWPQPGYATPGSAGIDLRACISQPLQLDPNTTELISAGFAIYISDPNYAGVILPRSGLGHKHGIVLGNTIGLIDADYQGELLISCYNRGNQKYIIEPGDRIAQLVLINIARPKLDLVTEFVTTERASGGFGHTGRS